MSPGEVLKSQPVAGPEVLEIRGLVTSVAGPIGRVPVVNGVSLAVAKGTTVGMVGESGSGKTMTALSVMKLLPAGATIASGQILLEGRDIVPLREADMRRVRGSRVSMIFQDPMTSLTPTMTVGRQVAEAVRLHAGLNRHQVGERVLELLDLVGLAEPSRRLRSYPHQLSGGQRQRVMIAIALAADPPVLLADEPTTALDVTIQAQILDLLDDLQRRLGMALVLISHDLGVVAGRADRVVVMYAGRVVEEGPTTELFRSCRHPYTEALLASMPESAGRAGRLYSIPGAPPEMGGLSRGCPFEPRCRYSTGICRSEEPVLGPWASEDRRVACHHPVS